MKKIMILFGVLFLSFLFSGCNINKQYDINGYVDVINDDFNINLASQEVINFLMSGDMIGLANWVHPSKGIRLSPYTYINIEEDNVLFSGDIANDTGKIYMWGHTDGKGDAIQLSISEYIDVYMGGIDYIGAADEIMVNQEILRGNNINNINEIYPDSKYIEYYIGGFDPQYEGMDWESLTIVFEEFEGKYYIVGIINGFWTI